jgi:DNA-binding Lrp family transcriptional regulator
MTFCTPTALRDLRYPGARVLSVDTVMGPVDVIVLLETDDLERLGDLIMEALREIAGVKHTATCLAVHLA